MTTETNIETCPMSTPAQPEHEWLQQFIGNWTWESECTMGPGQPPIKSSGTERVRSLGGLWIVAEGQGGMPDGGSAETILTLGFDPNQGTFVGTFVASMMAFLWRYENGELDEAKRSLTLHTTGPSMDPKAKGVLVPYRDVLEIHGDAERVLGSEARGEDGTWSRFNEIRYRRST